MTTAGNPLPDKPDLRDLLADGTASGPGSEMDEAYFERLRERIRCAQNPSQ